MPKDEFHFKKFSIKQDRCAMKVGTDGVLLGCWASLRAGANILDIGTGTGLLALMAAQRGAGRVDAVEIMPDAAAQARENAEASLWHEIVRIHTCDIGSFSSEEKYEHIWSNPPFYENALMPPDAQRCAARNNQSLSAELLAHSVARLLSANGILSIVFPADDVPRMESALAGEGLYPMRKMFIRTREGKEPKRVLMEFSRNVVRTAESSMILTDENGKRTEEYSKLTAEFYLDYT